MDYRNVMIALFGLALTACPSGPMMTGPAVPATAPQAYAVRSVDTDNGMTPGANRTAACMQYNCSASIQACGPSCQRTFSCVAGCNGQRECNSACVYQTSTDGMVQAEAVLQCYWRACSGS